MKRGMTRTSIAMAFVVVLSCVLLCASATQALAAPYSGTADGAAKTPSVVKPALDAAATVSVSEDATSILVDGFDFGISDFSRSNKGTNKLYSGSYYGYRWPMASSDAFVVVNTTDVSIVYIPADAAANLGVDIDDADFQAKFVTSLSAIDEAAGNGGPTLGILTGNYLFTSDPKIVVGDYVYEFAVEVEEGFFYATATLPGSDDASQGGIYAESGRLTSAGDTAIAAAPTGMDWLGRFFSTLDWSPLWVTLRTTGLAIIIIFILGLLAAWGTIKVSDRLKGILDTVFTIPMVLPPTVCGFLLLLLFGTSTEVGRWLIAHGIDLVFTWPAAVIACVVVGFPLMYRTARGAFESLDTTMLDAARTLGWSEWRIFIRIMMPLAWPTIASGTVLAFARAMGEFGCTLFFAGNYVGITQTIPIAIYYDWMAGSTDVAIFWVIVVILISFLVILFINIYSSRTQRYRVNTKMTKKQRDEEALEAAAAEAGERA